MKWTDGSVYKGLWSKGVQNGVGLMIFSDGQTKVGFFDNNVFTKGVRSM